MTEEPGNPQLPIILFWTSGQGWPFLKIPYHAQSSDKTILDSCTTTFKMVRIYFQDQKDVSHVFHSLSAPLKKNWEKDMVSMDAQSPQGGCCNMRHCLHSGQGQCCLSNSTPCSAAWGWGRLILSAVHQFVPYAFRKGWWMRRKEKCREYIVGGIGGTSISKQGKWCFFSSSYEAIRCRFIWILSFFCMDTYKPCGSSPKQWLINSLGLSC